LTERSSSLARGGNGNCAEGSPAAALPAVRRYLYAARDADAASIAELATSLRSTPRGSRGVDAGSHSPSHVPIASSALSS
jgi:hypothetical protein